MLGEFGLDAAFERKRGEGQMHVDGDDAGLNIDRSVDGKSHGAEAEGLQVAVPGFLDLAEGVGEFDARFGDEMIDAAFGFLDSEGMGKAELNFRHVKIGRSNRAGRELRRRIPATARPRQDANHPG